MPDAGSASYPGFVAYSGPSMWPTLQPHDVLELQASADHPPRIGDVIVFRDSSVSGETLVVHRIVGVGPGGLLTRGDAMPYADPSRLYPAEVQGTVVAVRRGSRRRRLRGGTSALLVVNGRRSCLALGRRLAQMAGRDARRPALHPRVLHALPARLRPRPVTFRSGSGEQTFLMLGRHRIGEYDVNTQRWLLRYPFGPRAGVR